MPIPSEEPSKQWLDFRGKVRHRNVVREHVYEERLLTDAFEARSFRMLFQQDHAETPPIRGGGDPTSHGFWRRVACHLQRSNDIQVKLR